MDPIETTEIAERRRSLEQAPVETRLASGPDLEDPALYFNRELSWLDFNDRVLQLAEDPSVPLLERAKFARSGSRTWTSSSWSGSPTCTTRSRPGTQAAAPTG